MNIVLLKSLLWFLFIFFIMASFPLQVLALSPLPSLIPYFILLLIILLTSFFDKKNSNIFYINNNTVKIILFYLFLVIFNTSWQVIFNFISLNDGLSSILIYAFPTYLYFYFYSNADEKEVRYVIFSIFVCGLISAFYFLYDSYGMLVLGRVSDFSYKMIDYISSRGNSNNINEARISAFYRSHGLLESHSISSAWIAFSAFSIFSILKVKKIISRSFLITIYIIFLIGAFNFTSILSFAFVLLIVEFNGLSIIRAIFRKNSLKLAITTFFLIILSIITFYNVFPEFVAAIDQLFLYQTDLLFGRVSYGAEKSTFLSALLGTYVNFFSDISNFPPGILIGDGFSTWGVSEKGGDYGHAETLIRFGLPLYIITFFGLIKICLDAINFIKSKSLYNEKINNHIKFAVSLIVYIFISSFHYSTWSAKSTLPLVMFSLAILSRYKANKI